MRDSGFIQVPRALFNNPALRPSKRRPASFFEAFCWLVAEAKYQDQGPIKRGQLTVSIRFLAQAFCWSKSKAGRFLASCQDNQLIRVEYLSGTPSGTTSGTPTGTQSGIPETLVTICNYQEFQGFEKSSGTASGTLSGTVSGALSGTNINNINNIISLSKTRAREDGPPNNPPEIGVRLQSDCPAFAAMLASKPGAAHIPMAAQWIADGIDYAQDILPTVTAWLADGYGVGNWQKLSQKIYQNHQARMEAKTHANRANNQPGPGNRAQRSAGGVGAPNGQSKGIIDVLEDHLAAKAEPRPVRSHDGHEPWDSLDPASGGALFQDPGF